MLYHCAALPSAGQDVEVYAVLRANMSILQNYLLLTYQKYIFLIWIISFKDGKTNM